MTDLRVGFYGDDFTGSVDALLQFIRRGWRGRLFVGLPSPELIERAGAECDVVGIAGIARSLPANELDAEVRPAFAALLALGPQILQYKACSTADSSPTIGSLGRVVEIGRELVGAAAVPMLFAQPDFGRYTVFGHHFAAEAGTVYRLDLQPTMSTHPSTPMTESDLALHLSRQTTLPIASIPFTRYDTSEVLGALLRESDAAAVVLDAATDDDIGLVGRAVASLEAPVFAIGSGGLSAGLAAAHPGLENGPARSTTTRGPILAISGSRSAQTRRQVEAARAAGWLVRPLPGGAGSPEVGEIISALRAGTSVVLTAELVVPGGGGTVLDAIAEAAASVVLAASRAGVTRRLVVCGGDTSGRVTQLLGVESLSIAANPWANIVLLRAHAADPAIDGLELLLKGGQVGDDDLLERIRILAKGRFAPPSDRRFA